MNANERKELQRLLDDLNDIYKKIGERDFSLNVSQATIKDLENVKNLLSQAKRNATSLDSGFGSIATTIRGMLKEFSKVNSNTKDATQSMGKLERLTRKLYDHESGISKLSTNQLNTLKEKIDSERQSLNAVVRNLRKKKHLNETEQAIYNNLTRGLDIRKLTGKAIDNAIKSSEELDEVTSQTNKVLDNTQGILNRLGLRGYTDTFKSLKKDSRDYAESLKNGKEKLSDSEIKSRVLSKTLKDGAKVFSDEISKGFDILFVKTFKELLTSSEKIRAELSKTFALGLDQSQNLRNELAFAAKYSGDIYFNFERAAKALMSFNSLIKGSVKLTTDELQTMSQLTEILGYSNEEAAQLVTNAKLRGETSESYISKLKGELAIMQIQEGTALNLSTILGDIAKISVANELSMKAQGESLAYAAFQAGKLALSQAQIENIQSSLLNFQSSIEAEMEAELLTGRQLNLEAARRAALLGKQGDLAAEISRQVGTAAEFGKLNVIQQSALAKAFGLNREELAKSLKTQELLNGQFDTMADAKAHYNKLVKDGLKGEELREKFGNTLLHDQIHAQETQEKFKNAVIKLKDAMLPITNAFADILHKVTAALDAINEMPGIISTIGQAFMGIGIAKLFLRFSGLAKLFKSIPKSIKGIGAAAKSIFKGGGTAAAAAGGAGVKKGMGAVLKGGLKKIGGKMIPGVGLMFALNDFMEGDITGGVLNLIGGIASFFPGVGTAISAIMSGIDIGREVIGANKPEAKMAAGGIVTKPTRALIGEAGPEAVVPLHKLENMNGSKELKLLNLNIEKLIRIVEQGGDVYMDAAKVGKAISLASSRMG